MTLEDSKIETDQSGSVVLWMTLVGSFILSLAGLLALTIARDDENTAMLICAIVILAVAGIMQMVSLIGLGVLYGLRAAGLSRT